MANNYIGLHKRFGKDYKRKAVDAQTKMLIKYASDKLNHAYMTRGFRNRTFNLADSYVWAVYYHGSLQGSGYLWNSRVATTDSTFHNTKVNGRKLAMEFTDKYHSNSMNKWEVVFAATAPYASYLEGGAVRRVFYVITHIYDTVTADFKGKATVYTIISY